MEPILHSIEIENFRSLPKVIYLLGKKLTIISGHNATGKSTLLGLLAQPFGLESEKDIWGTSFSSKFDQKFKLSARFDHASSEPYRDRYFIDTYAKLHPEGKRVPVALFERTAKENEEKKVRFVAGAVRKSGHGNIEIPVIFLGLKRVYPLGETERPSIHADGLDDEERSFFVENYRRILQEIHTIKNSQQLISGAEKRTLGIETDCYDSLGISAGQDNLGQILAAFISFHRIKKRLNGDYKGALLCIDEVDVTLHPASQRGLLELLFRESQKHNIQIIVTTHSLDFISSAYSYHARGENGLAVWHLKNIKGNVEFQLNPSVQELHRNLHLTKTSQSPSPRISVYFEDEEAKLFFKKLVSVYRKSSLMQCFRLDVLNGGYGTLKKAAKLGFLGLKEAHNALFIIDGDQQINAQDVGTLLSLPGNKSPEKVFGEFLDSLPAEDYFWSDNYSKQDFLSRYPHEKDSRDNWKHWFNNEKCNWGQRAMSQLFKRWREEHENDIDCFLRDLLLKYNGIAKRMNIPSFPLNRP